jgi:hypothetical protein
MNHIRPVHHYIDTGVKSLLASHIKGKNFPSFAKRVRGKGVVNIERQKFLK